MGLLKNLFKKDATAKPVVQTQEAAPAAAEAVNAAPEKAAAERKPKHGEDGVCCGSCQ